MLIFASKDFFGKCFMFGSRRWFRYSNDQGTIFGVNLDESNTELINPASVGVTIAADTVAVPADTKVRKVKLEASNGSTKTVVVLTRDRYDAITLGQTFAAPVEGEENPAGTSFVVVQKIPERILRAPRPIDTGKLDGDNP